MMQTLDDYILEHIDAEPEFLHTLDRDTHLYHLRPRMCSGHLQGRILKMLVRMIRPRRILELGTFTGYSALCLAEGMPESSELHTIEIDDELEDFIRSHFDSSEFADRLHLHIGDAKEILASMGDVKFDLVFMDANKREYCEYYDLVFPMLEGVALSLPTIHFGTAMWSMSRILRMRRHRALCDLIRWSLWTIVSRR